MTEESLRDAIADVVSSLNTDPTRSGGQGAVSALLRRESTKGKSVSDSLLNKILFCDTGDNIPFSKDRRIRISGYLSKRMKARTMS